MSDATNGAPARKRSLTEEMRDADIGIPDGPDAGADRDEHTAFRDGLCRRTAWCVEPATHGGTCTVIGVLEVGPAKTPTKGMAKPAQSGAGDPGLLPLPEVGSTWMDRTDSERTLRVVATDPKSSIERNVIGVVSSSVALPCDYSCGWKEFHRIWLFSGSEGKV